MVHGLNVYPVGGKYPKVDTLDERFDKRFILKDAFRHLLPSKADGQPDFGRTKPILPNKMAWRDSRAAPDFDSSVWRNVSGKAKDIIEDMEPGVHDFVPVDYVYSRGKTEIRFWLHVGNEVDCVDGGRSNMALHRGQWRPPGDLLRNGVALPDDLNPDAPSRLCFRREAVAPYHMWWDRRLGSTSIFVSDALAERLKTEGATGIKWEGSAVECA